METGREDGAALPAPAAPHLKMLPGSSLPLFKGRSTGATDDIWYYAPGYLSLVSPQRSEFFEADLLSPRPTETHALELRRRATEAMASWTARHAEPFAPVCLTVYPSNRCNAACSYCYSGPSRSRDVPNVDAEAVSAAADVVAANCRARSLPFTVVLHGGGEPTLDRRLADKILDTAATAASREGVGLFRYVASNGIMSARKAAWLAKRVDLVGLSCDGPGPIQDRQRPLPGGKRGSRIVERTASIIRAAGTPLHVRVTVTPASMARLGEIADYVCRRLQPGEIHVEPVYAMSDAATRPHERFVADQAEEYVAEFLKGRAVARQCGVEWSSSEVRPGEIHGPYCEVFRDVLHVVPGSVATACFGAGDGAHARELGMIIGGRVAGRAEFAIDAVRVRVLRQALDGRSARCDECFNRYHCARGCPESCPAESFGSTPTFRCRIERLLGLTYLGETARWLLASAPDPSHILGGPVTSGIPAGALP